jgi:hypothetical protein
MGTMERERERGMQARKGSSPALCQHASNNQSATGDSGTCATRLTMHIDTSLCRYIYFYSSSLPSFLESQLALRRLVSQVQ